MRGLVVVMLIFVAGSLHGAGAVGDEDPFAGLAPLSDESLAERRGGLNVGGFEVEFGVIVTAQNELVASLATDLEALRDALAAAGEEASLYGGPGGPRSLDALTTIVVNTQDGVRLEHFVRIDVVIEDAHRVQLMRGGRDVLSALGVPDTLPGF